ncbi:MAG: hypothetical protein ACOH5I_19210 [Oligoflexus sp.]
MIGLAILTAVLVVAILFTPFVWGEGGHLQAASSVNSLEKLEAMRTAILKRYLEDETAFEKNRLGQVMWQQRRQYLVNRYVDATRRLDYLRHLEKLSREQQS